MNEQFSLPLGGAAPQPRILYFDLETKFSADDVGGWNHIERMGMACGVCYDSVDEAFHTYMEDQAQGLIEHLQKAELIVGFNHIRFDYKVLTGYSTVNFLKLPSFDMLVDLKNILGHRLKLDSLASATLGETKSADGLQSLRWVKEGKLDLVRDYCKKDVEVTKNLFDYGANEGRVFYSNYGKKVPVDVDWNVERLLKKIRR